MHPTAAYCRLMRSPEQSPAAFTLQRLWARSALTLALPLTLALTGCPSTETTEDGPSDAKTDGPPPPRVQEIDPCPASVAVEITEIVTATGFDYSPNPATIKAGQVVRFRLSGPHNARAAGIFATNAGKTECYRFNRQETVTFACDAHGFIGRLIVQ
jgi:hypothetical protein